MLEINDESGLSQHKGWLSVHIVNYITKNLPSAYLSARLALTMRQQEHAF